MVKVGVRKVNPLPIITLGAGVALLLYAVSPGRSVILRKIWYHNAAGADTDLEIGTGLPAPAPVPFAAALPPIHTINGFSGFIGEPDCIGYEFDQNITMESVVAGVTVTVEVEEIG